MKVKPSIQDLIKRFKLKPLPVEGGLYIRSYCSGDILPESALPERYGENKPAGSAIYYLYTPDPDHFSAMHTLPTDEIFHFYLGDPVEMFLIYPNGTCRSVILGPNVLAGQEVQFPVPRGVWQGSRLLPGGEFALVGTTMAPGFTPKDYLGASGEDLLRLCPAAAEKIGRFIRREEKPCSETFKGTGRGTLMTEDPDRDEP